MPKTDSGKSLLFTNHLLCSKTCNLYARLWKTSIPASLVSSNVKLGFLSVVPQLYSPRFTTSHTARRSWLSHKHDIPNSRNHKYVIHSSYSTRKSQTHENAIVVFQLQPSRYAVPQNAFSQICRFSNTFSQAHGSSIPLPSFMYLRIPSHRFTNSRTSQKSWLSRVIFFCSMRCTASCPVA